MFTAELKPGLKRTSLFSNLSRWAVGTAETKVRSENSGREAKFGNGANLLI